MTQFDSSSNTHVVTREARWFLRLFAPLGVLFSLALTTIACSIGGVGELDAFALGRSFQLDDGDQRDGDQVVFAYDIDLRENSVVDGDLTLTARRVVFDASVTGDVMVIADRLTLGEAALISGDLIACVNTLEQDDGARVAGELREECLDNDSASLADTVESSWDSWRNSAFFRLSTVLVGALLFGAFAALSNVFFSRGLVRMSESLRQVPLLSGGVGLVTTGIAVGLTLLYALSLKLVVPVVLLPVVLFLWFALALFSVLGWLALAAPFGVFLFRLLRMDTQPRMIAAAIGGIVLALLLRLWSVFWVNSWMILLALLIFGAVGLGPVLMTRFGTRSYRQVSLFRKS